MTSVFIVRIICLILILILSFLMIYRKSILEFIRNQTNPDNRSEYLEIGGNILRQVSILGTDCENVNKKEYLENEKLRAFFYVNHISAPGIESVSLPDYPKFKQPQGQYFISRKHVALNKTNPGLWNETEIFKKLLYRHPSLDFKELLEFTETGNIDEILPSTTALERTYLDEKFDSNNDDCTTNSILNLDYMIKNVKNSKKQGTTKNDHEVEDFSVNECDIHPITYSTDVDRETTDCTLVMLETCSSEGTCKHRHRMHNNSIKIQFFNRKETNLSAKIETISTKRSQVMRGKIKTHRKRTNIFSTYNSDNVKGKNVFHLNRQLATEELKLTTAKMKRLTKMRKRTKIFPFNSENNRHEFDFNWQFTTDKLKLTTAKIKIRKKIISVEKLLPIYHNHSNLQRGHEVKLNMNVQPTQEVNRDTNGFLKTPITKKTLNTSSNQQNVKSSAQSGSVQLENEWEENNRKMLNAKWKKVNVNINVDISEGANTTDKNFLAREKFRLRNMKRKTNKIKHFKNPNFKYNRLREARYKRKMNVSLYVTGCAKYDRKNAME